MHFDLSNSYSSDSISLYSFSLCSHLEEDEELRGVPGPSSQVDDDPEVTQFYVNPIAKPIPHGRTQNHLQDTISELNMQRTTKNGLEVSKECSYSK